MCGESDREQGEERAFDGVGQGEIGGERRRRERDGERGESICEEIPEEETIEIKRRADEGKWTDGG